MNINSKEYHPERLPHEMLPTNHVSGTPFKYGYKTKRLGENAYTRTDRKIVKGLQPVFIDCKEFIEFHGIEYFESRYPDTAKEYAHHCQIQHQP